MSYKTTIFVLAGHSNSTFDIAFSGLLNPLNHSEELLAELVRILKPGGWLLLRDGEFFWLLMFANFSKTEVFTNFVNFEGTVISCKCERADEQ